MLGMRAMSPRAVRGRMSPTLMSPAGLFRGNRLIDLANVASLRLPPRRRRRVLSLRTGKIGTRRPRS